jgi:serine/threonine protein kinase
VRGDVKLFDFWLAKEFDPTKSTDGQYKLTGDTGSPRYMACEVALDKPYNENVDVYSMAILSWQMFTMETPFEGYTVRLFKNKVIEGGYRPAIDPAWPFEIKNMLQRGWCESKDRLSMDEFSNMLRDEINMNSDEEVCDIMDASRKSEMSLRIGPK